MCIKYEILGSVENQNRFGRPIETSPRTDSCFHGKQKKIYQKPQDKLC